jgi:hypothetical protein
VTPPPTKKEEDKEVVKKEVVMEEDVKKEEDVEDEETTTTTTTTVEKDPTNYSPEHVKLVEEADKLAKAIKFRSNEELLTTAGTPHAPIPYATLVGVFEQIDKITSRLENQALLTSLFRQVLLTTPSRLVSYRLLGQ